MDRARRTGGGGARARAQLELLAGYLQMPVAQSNFGLPNVFGQVHEGAFTPIEGNDASTRLLGRLGFRQEARFVDGVHFKGAWATQLVFALLEDEWREPSAVG